MKEIPNTVPEYLVAVRRMILKILSVIMALPVSHLEMVSSQNMCFSMNLGRLYVSNLDQVTSPSLNPSWSQVIISTNHGIFIPTIMHSITIFNTCSGSMLSLSPFPQTVTGFHTNPPHLDSCGGRIFQDGAIIFEDGTIILRSGVISQVS